MRTANWLMCIALCGLLSCHGDRPGASADEPTQGAEITDEPTGEAMDPLHPVDPYPAGTPPLDSEEMGGTGGIGAIGGGGTGGIGGIGGVGGVIH